MSLYKSKGEEKIANFLKRKKIKFIYEKKLKVKDLDNKKRIWYPDFYLVREKIFIEYFGLSGNSDYDKGTKHKKKVYYKNGVDCINVYPKTLYEKNFEAYIYYKIRDIKNRRIKNLILPIFLVSIFFGIFLFNKILFFFVFTLLFIFFYFSYKKFNFNIFKVFKK